MDILTIERITTTSLVIEIAADSVKQAFEAVKAGQGTEVCGTQKTELLVRDYPLDH